jgi:uncharacterized protein YdhG (YjbR/CyaY superfamily)
MNPQQKFNSVDEYISFQPEGVRHLLEELRQIIRQTAPTASEVISYNMPAYKIKGILVYFAANKQHIGFYPTSSPIVIFNDELTNYKTSKGAIQFPIKSGIPTKLVKKIVEYRIHEDEIRASAKK